MVSDLPISAIESIWEDLTIAAAILAAKAAIYLR
jgi:hypothetical protein